MGSGPWPGDFWCVGGDHGGQFPVSVSRWRAQKVGRPGGIDHARHGPVPAGPPLRGGGGVLHPRIGLRDLALMYLEGITINVMSLSGIVLGIGLLVDNAVVVMENFDRLMSENPTATRKEIMAQAAREMEGPMVGGTLTTVVVFLPFSLLAKQTQLLFAGISFTVTASLFASLFVALTLVPALGARIDPHHFNTWTPGWTNGP
jgi:hypothetical protein